jgi:hypothetical protein
MITFTQWKSCMSWNSRRWVVRTFSTINPQRRSKNKGIWRGCNPLEAVPQLAVSTLHRFNLQSDIQNVYMKVCLSRG